MESIFIGLCVVNVIGLPKPKGYLPYLNTFQELFIVTGTIYASGLYFVIIFNPLIENFFGFPFLLLVPSGKITAPHLFLLMFFENLPKVLSACLAIFPVN